VNERSTLLIALARIGDLVQCFPAISDLSRKADDNPVDLMVQNELVPVAKLHPRAGRIISFDGDAFISALRSEKGWVTEGLSRADKVLKKIEELNPELIVNLTHTALSGVICGLIKNATVRGRSCHLHTGSILNGDWARYFFTLLQSRSCNAVNIVDINREISRGIRGPVDPPQIPGDALDFARQILGDLRGKRKIALAIGAHHPLRRWPPERWARTAGLIVKRYDADFVLLGGSMERELAATIEKTLPDRCLNLCGVTDPVQLFAVIEQCDLLIGHDSGPLHIAAALGKPCLGIYLAMASTWETAPYREGAVSFEPDLPCHPCREEGGCTEPRCHETISAEAVADASSRLLAGEQPANYPGCIVRISTFNGSGRLTLAGDQRRGDELRRFWGGLLKHFLTYTTLIDAANPSFSVNDEFLANIEEKLQRMSNTILGLIRQTIAAAKDPAVRLSRVGAAGSAFIDPLARELPTLIASYPEFRPLFELYRMDCLGSDEVSCGLNKERVLAAQDKLLRRIVTIRRACQMDQTQKIAIMKRHDNHLPSTERRATPLCS